MMGNSIHPNANLIAMAVFSMEPFHSVYRCNSTGTVLYWVHSLDHGLCTKINEKSDDMMFYSKLYFYRYFLLSGKKKYLEERHKYRELHVKSTPSNDSLF